MSLRVALALAFATVTTLVSAAVFRPFTLDSVLKDLAKTHPEATRVTDATPPGVVARENLVYSRPEGLELQLDLYRPEGTELLPAVILVHGGGWLSGDRTMERPLARHLAARGFVAVPVSYRLGTAGRFPAPLHDLKAAVRWLRAHAGDYGIDPAHIGAMGGSAGGTLVTLLGATNGLPAMEGTGGSAGQSSTVQAVVNLDGSVNFADNALIQSAETKPSPYFEFVHGIYSRNREVWIAASPITYTGPQSAPTLFIKSTVTQPILAGRDEMSARLRILGVRSEIKVYPGAPHPFWLVHPWFDQVLDDASRFLRETL